jgi:ABC-type transport system substrate-binding protein
VKVRQAVAHMINRDAFLQESTLVTATTFALPYDPARAKALLTEAGWMCDTTPCVKAIADANGNVVTRTLHFKLTTTEREPRNLVAQAIQRQLAHVGFGVDVEIVFGLGKQSKMFAPYDQGGILLTRNFDAALYQTTEPLALGSQFSCASIPNDQTNDTSKGNASGFCDEEVDKLIAAAESSENVISPAAYDSLISQTMGAIHNAAPVIPLYHQLHTMHSRGVTGLKPSARLPVTWNAWEWRYN